VSLFQVLEFVAVSKVDQFQFQSSVSQFQQNVVGLNVIVDDIHVLQGLNCVQKVFGDLIKISLQKCDVLTELVQWLAAVLHHEDYVGAEDETMRFHYEWLILQNLIHLELLHHQLLMLKQRRLEFKRIDFRNLGDQLI
jgi:hypothetical protein